MKDIDQIKELLEEILFWDELPQQDKSDSFPSYDKTKVKSFLETKYYTEKRMDAAYDKGYMDGFKKGDQEVVNDMLRGI